MGTIGILNVGAGDTKISCSNKDDPNAIKRFKKTVTELLRRGFALLVEVEPGLYRRAKSFDEATLEYIVADFEPPIGRSESEPTAAPADATGEPEEPEAGKAGRKIKRREDRRIPATATRATAVARIAGG